MYGIGNLVYFLITLDESGKWFYREDDAPVYKKIVQKMINERMIDSGIPKYKYGKLESIEYRIKND